ncbi:hypothetical protein T229_12410 [Tannerella sp. oral taxon BU063 isolate Cell 5]|uniref:HEPN domain-containing protein n=2 Tax=Tannerella serpentiformis TaxID=712710 RepID=W2CBK2_9BACT|nr:hypothetical protein N425_11935 [Tannerella sp. oral taxon BU063 isolate Cell 2]ETK03842.1 hypothetical protein T229_12410 [Tannerella sp. oral taxon BU063 isolate Cell 5]
MKTKAIHNIKAAEALIDKAEEGYYTASIHHVYYAVFQYMKYELAHTDMEPLSDEEQTVKAKEHRMGSHDFIIKEIKRRISRLADPDTAQDFTQYMRELKGDRIDADYRSRQFTLEESLACKRLAEELITKLKTYFGDL